VPHAPPITFFWISSPAPYWVKSTDHSAHIFSTTTEIIIIIREPTKTQTKKHKKREKISHRRTPLR
jgi:hypothetical protein